MLQVKAPVAGDRHRAAGNLGFHLHQRRRKFAEQLGIRVTRDERRNLAFDQFTRAEDLEQTEGPGADTARAGRRVAGDDVHPGAGAHFDQAFDLERDQRLAHRRPRDTELQRQVALGGQARADAVLAVADQRAQLIGNLAVEPAGFDALQRHRNWSSGQATWAKS